MKHQIRFLITGLSLTGLLACLASPAAAQLQSTSFSMTVVSLSISVTPGNVPLGTLAAGAVISSDPTGGASRAPIRVTNSSGIPVSLFIAGTNAKDVTNIDNPTMDLNKTTAGQDQFRWGFEEAGAGGGLKFLAGPTGSEANRAFPNLGEIEAISVAANTETKTLNWEYHAPTVSTKNTAQDFSIAIAAAQVGGGGSVVANAFAGGALGGVTP